MSSISDEVTNRLESLPPEIRRQIDKQLLEQDHRALSSTQRFERNRKNQLPIHERYCFKEIDDIGESTPANLSQIMQKSPRFRNMNYTGQTALLKAILLQALITQSLIFDINRTNFEILKQIPALVCVLKSIQNITILPSEVNSTQTMHVGDVAWIIRVINENSRPTTLHLDQLPVNYFMYTLKSQYGKELNLPPVCKINLICNPNTIFHEWRETSSIIS